MLCNGVIFLIGIRFFERCSAVNFFVFFFLKNITAVYAGDEGRYIKCKRVVH